MYRYNCAIVLLQLEHVLATYVRTGCCAEYMNNRQTDSDWVLIKLGINAYWINQT